MLKLHIGPHWKMAPVRSGFAQTCLFAVASLMAIEVHGQALPVMRPRDSTGAIRTPPMKNDTISLPAVRITAKRSAVDVQLDKKVYRIGTDILSESGAAADVLNGIPSVTADATGTIRLRGNSNVTILVNGRRSGLTPANILTQIAAGSIERIEVMTSPSARYDAAGSAGTINIILKKNSKDKFGGQARVSFGHPNDYNLNANMNYKAGHWNLFATLGGRYSDYVGFYSTRQIATRNGAASLEKVQHENRHDDGRLIYLGGDYQANSKNTFTLAYFKNATRDIDQTALDYAFGPAGADSLLTRQGNSRENRSYNQFESNYTRTFDREGQKLTIDVQYDFWDSDKTWDLFTRKTFPLPASLPAIRTLSRGDSRDLVMQSDFVYPFSKQSAFEAGLKMETRSVLSDYKAGQYGNNGWAVLDGIDNKLNYKENIGAVYAQYKSQWGKLSYQAGLRYEYTQVDIHDRKGDFGSEKQYGRLFPTVNMSYGLQEGMTIQANYSRRIGRPSLWSLYPFNEVTDLNAQFVGNPGLNPSFTHVAELVLSRQWNKFTLNPTVYAHFTTAPILQYTFQSDKGVMITMPFNLASEKRYGAELSATYNPLPWLSLNGQLTGYLFRQYGFYRDTDFSFSNRSWNGRLNVRLKLPWKLTFQCRLDAQGPDNDAQSRTRPYYYLASGLSRTMFKGKATVVVDGTNVLNSNKRKTTIAAANYQIDRVSNFNAARFRLGFTYRFSKSETQTFRNRKEANRD
ncbi:TonB-dependent receptor [Paraflavitalea sp. CAU 1676]|uniref:TonB-dependent receptor domain-containing protein n=1 Tax=Paraflavitalea sp. CAU 1676 TaxID=3032598 RepID=UPI0023DAB5EC|nr:TonB-dependent receptor [Paraflavitalea sp. CAU 1676]MDF2188388.1 TonB-dependent receptor [Paraflavitalea sp. CAU 1676]